MAIPWGSLIGAGSSILGGLFGDDPDPVQYPAQNRNIDVNPPAWTLPYAEDFFTRAQDMADTPSEPYPFNPEQARMPFYERLGLNRAARRGQAGGFLVNPTLRYARDVLRGDYLDAPGLADASQYAINRFMPRSMSQFEASGRGGSGLAANQLSAGISDIVANQYGRERALQQGMAGMAPQLERFGYSPFRAMQSVGQAYRDFEQEGLDQNYLADRDRWEFQQREPRDRLGEYGAALRSLFPYVGRSQREAGTNTYFGPTTGQKIAGIGNIAGGLVNDFMSGGDRAGGGIDLGPTSSPMTLGQTGGNFDMWGY